MGKNEIIIFIILGNLLLLIFIGGILFFVYNYRKKKLLYEKEKATIEEQHHLDLLKIQLESQSQAMQFIGQEIHDSVAQKITLASIYIQRMEFESLAGGEKEKLAAVSKIINDSLLGLRQLSKSLTDNKLQHADLRQLISIECDQVNATGVCLASFEISELPVIDISTKSSLLRIVQEFIQNSIKHSGCKEIRIKISSFSDNLTLLLEDDGKGFDFDKVGDKGIGLDSIRRRIQMLGGEYNMRSNTGSKGVSLLFTVPINPSNI